MSIAKLLEIIRICLPVFVLIGLGKILSVKKVMTVENKALIDKIVHNFSLPSLIIYNIVKEPSLEIFKPLLIVPAFISIFVIAILFFLLALFFKFDVKILAGVVIGSFWGNIAYMGFPLSMAAFGESGFTNTAIINAFMNPTYIIIGTLIITIFVNKNNSNIVDIVKKSILNPLVLSAFIGIFLTLIADLTLDRQNLPASIDFLSSIFGSLLQLLGTMGLPLALISVGGGLNLSQIYRNKKALFLATVGKLIIMPLMTLIIFYLLFPKTGVEEKGVVILLMGMPSAVAAYIVYKKLIGDEGFISSFLVISTIAGIFTIPVLLYFLI